MPLCAYVEEEEPIEQQKVDENAPFEDPNLGCIKCQIEPHEQCEDIPKNICTSRPDPKCKICPKSETGYIGKKFFSYLVILVFYIHLYYYFSPA